MIEIKAFILESSNAQIEPDIIMKLAQGSNNPWELSDCLIKHMAQDAVPVSTLVSALEDSKMKALISIMEE